MKLNRVTRILQVANQNSNDKLPINVFIFTTAARHGKLPRDECNLFININNHYAIMKIEAFKTRIGKYTCISIVEEKEVDNESGIEIRITPQKEALKDFKRVSPHYLVDIKDYGTYQEKDAYTVIRLSKAGDDVTIGKEEEDEEEFFHLLDNWDSLAREGAHKKSSDTEDSSDIGDGETDGECTPPLQATKNQIGEFLKLYGISVLIGAVVIICMLTGAIIGGLTAGPVGVGIGIAAGFIVSVVLAVLILVIKICVSIIKSVLLDAEENKHADKDDTLETAEASPKHREDKHGDLNRMARGAQPNTASVPSGVANGTMPEGMAFGFGSSEH